MNILLNRAGNVKIGSLLSLCTEVCIGLLTGHIANIGMCLLQQPSLDLDSDCISFARVLFRLFAPESSLDRLLRQQVDDSAFEFYCCVKDGRLELAIRVRGAIASTQECISLQRL